MLSASFRGNPQNARWLQLAVGLAALGYSATVAHRLLFLPLPAAAYYPELAAAVLTACSAAIFHRQPRTASLVTLAVVWAEPLASVMIAGELAASVLLVFPVVVATSGLVFGRASAVITAAGSMVSIPLAFAWGQAQHGLGFTIAVTDVSTLIVTEFVLAGIGLVTWAMLRESEERFRSLIESVPNVAVQGYDRNRRIIFWNSASTRLYGFTAEEAIGRQLEELIIPPAMRAEVMAAVDRWVSAGVPIPTGEVTLQKKGGEPLHVLSSHVMQHNGQGEPEMYCIDVDLTERDRAAAVLQENEERFRVLFNRSNDAVMVYTLKPDGTPEGFIEVNSIACSLLEYTRAELLQLSPAALEPPAAAPASHERLRRLQAAGRLLEEVELVTRRGRVLTAEISAQIFEFRQRPTVLAVARDVSARKSLEIQLRQAQKMEVVGRLAGGVAHDFNNILTAMLLNLEVMRNAAAGDDPAPHLADIEAMAKRAARLTQQLLMFARQQALQPSRFELNAAITNLLRMLRRLLGEHITISTLTTSPQLWLEADSSLVDQVVMNLCLNARDAMPDGGTLKLATRLVEFGAELPAAQPEARAGRFACLEVTDTGCGMAPEVIEHLFEPFFTTKGVGQGTGLGLASVHGIVHQHQGWIEVDSQVGRGSTFKIYLPCGESQAKPPSVHPFAPLRARRNETILLVEDDEVVRRVSRAMLLMLGYQILVAADGPEAIRIWAERAGTIDLLLTDMVMPGGLTGLKLGLHFRESKPGLRIVIMSGYSSAVAPSDVLRDANIGFLAKPFDSTTLAHAIYHGLDPA